MEWLWIWVAVIVISAVVEFFSLDMTSIWATCGGICGLILYICGTSYIVQLIVAIAVTIVCIIFFRPFVKRKISKKTVPTNISSIIGVKTKLLTPITEDSNGSVKVNDIVWTAKSLVEEIIESGEEVEIVDVKGNKLIVNKIKKD